MGRIQDKDFDQLFKDQLEGAEVTPSANLWGNIEKQLAPGKRAVLPAYWMAAAVVFIAVSVGVLMPKNETMKLRGASDFVASSRVEPTTTPKPVDVAPVVEAQVESTPLVIAPRLNQSDVKKDFIAMQPIAATRHPVDMDVKNTTAITAVAEPEVPVNEVMMARVEAPQEFTAIPAVEQAEYKGIRNVGDLVNIVVNKVDKRDKKLIQFNTDEDDNSSLIAINIGFLKFNKRDK